VDIRTVRSVLAAQTRVDDRADRRSGAPKVVQPCARLRTGTQESSRCERAGESQYVRDYDERRVEVGARKRQDRARWAYRIVREQQNRSDQIIDEHHRFNGRDVTVIPRQLDIREWRRDGERQQEPRRDGESDAPLLGGSREI
jgi:hypothetical protein